MKKNIVNDKVIRAMAIGISAMLATATPMTALAAEEGEDSTPEAKSGEESKSESKVSEAKEAAESASESVDTAQVSAETVKNDVVTNVKAGEAGTVESDTESGETENIDLAQAVIDAAANVENADIKGGTPLADAKTDIANTNIQLEIAKNNDDKPDEEYGKAETAASAAADIASEAEKAMNDANAKADEQVQQIKNATTVADANEAYDELAATAEQAQKEFNAKLEVYNKAKAAYDEAAAKVAEYEKAYNDAIATANDSADAAKKELDQAQKKAQKLEDAVKAAKDAVENSAAMEIAKLEDLTSNDGGLNWRNEDKLFIAIMEKYYLPELGIQGAVVERVQGRVQGKDNNEYNYFTAKYMDENGVEQVKYFNFKMDGNSKDDIVIFEKRIEEVKWEKYQNDNPDQYVKDKDNKTTVTVEDVAKGLDGGSIVKVDGKYVEKNDVTDSKTLVSDSKITGTSTEDVTVDEKKQESWQYDAETGKLVKTVTADVTTITYTDATFTSGSFATEKDRNNDAATTKNDLEKTGKNVNVTNTEQHIATGTYIPAFKETININEIIRASSGNKAIEKAKEKALDDNDITKGWWEIFTDKNLEDQGYYILKDSDGRDLIESDLKSNCVKENWGEDDYQVTGSVSVTYAKITKETIDFNLWDAFWSDLGFSDKKSVTIENAKQFVESTGGIFLNLNSLDGNFNTAQISYVKGYKVETEAQDTKKDAEEAFENIVSENLKEQQSERNKNTVENIAYGVNQSVESKYSYSVDYLKKDKETKENKAVATETYGNASGLSGQIIQNKNYYDAINKGESKKILLTQKDTAYRAFVDDAKALTGKYDRLLTEARDANEKVEAAQKEVDKLKAAIEALEGKSTNTDNLKELENKLKDALNNRDAAEKTLNEILKKLENAGVTRDEVVDRLTPNTPDGGTGGNPGGTGGNGGNPGGGTPGTTYDGFGTDTTTDGLATVVTTTTTATATANTAVVAQAVAANGAGAANVAAGNAAGNAAAGNEGVVTIEDEAAPLAASIDDQDTTDTEQNQEDAQTVTIEDEASPLDASIDQEKMSWWWLLIVLVLGATGYEMYRKHQEKKKAAEEIKVEE